MVIFVIQEWTLIWADVSWSICVRAKLERTYRAQLITLKLCRTMDSNMNSLSDSHLHYTSE